MFIFLICRLLRTKGLCKFVTARSVGTFNAANLSYDPSSAIGMVASSKVDTFFRSTDYISIRQSFVDFSDALSNLEYRLMQLIDKKSRNQFDSSWTKQMSFLAPPSDLICLIMIGLLLYFVFRFLLSSTFKLTMSKLNIFGPEKSELPPKRQFPIIVLSFTMLLFLIKTFYSNNLNTDNVIVDASDLLFSDEQIAQTDKELCVEQSGEESYMQSAPINTLPRIVYEKRNKQDLCVFIFDGNLGNAMSRTLNKAFFVFMNFNLSLVARFLQTFFKKDVFLRNEAIYDTVRNMILRKDLRKDVKSLINRRYVKFGRKYVIEFRFNCF